MYIYIALFFFDVFLPKTAVLSPGNYIYICIHT